MILKVGLSLVVAAILIYNIAIKGLTTLNTVVFGLFILSIMGEISRYMKEKKDAAVRAAAEAKNESLEKEVRQELAELKKVIEEEEQLKEEIENEIKNKNEIETK